AAFARTSPDLHRRAESAPHPASAATARRRRAGRGWVGEVGRGRCGCRRKEECRMQNAECRMKKVALSQFFVLRSAFCILQSPPHPPYHLIVALDEADPLEKLAGSSGLF